MESPKMSTNYKPRPRLCKYCKRVEIVWNTRENRYEELDGTSHDRSRCETAKAMPSPEQKQQQPQESTTRYDSAYLIPKEEWATLQLNMKRLTEYYGEMLEHMSVLSGIIKNNQRLAEAEADFDRDREQGLT